MNTELLLLGMDIPKTVEKFVNERESEITNGMTESELKAYRMGVLNTINSLSIWVNNDMLTVHIKDLEIPTELDFEEIERYSMIASGEDYSEQF